MKNTHYIIYLCDNEIFLLHLKKDKIYNEKLKSIQYEQIIDNKLFSNELNEFLKKCHIKGTLFGENIVFIKNNHLSFLNIEKYTEILKEYFRKVEFQNIEEILKIDEKNGIFLFTENYLDYYFKKGQITSIRINLEIFSNNLNKTIHHAITAIYKPKKLMVLGSMETISKIAEDIMNNYNIPTNFPEIYSHYLFEQYKKIKNK